MPSSRRQCLAGLATLGFAAALPWPARAGVYPDRPVRFIVPYPAGGVVDIAARIVADHLGSRWGQQVLVDNRAGANGNLGAQAAKAATPDGHTVLVGSLFITINPLIDRNARFATSDFEPVAQLGAAPNLLVVPAASPARTMAEFITLARQNPGRFNTPNPGTGSSNHLSVELLQQVTGIELLQVPYKGQPPFLVDLASGQLQFAYLTAALALPLIANGKLRALAVAANTRLKALPEVPTVAEAGLRGTEVLPWNGLFVPLGTPRAAVDRLAQEVLQALQAPEVQQRYAAIAAEIPAAPLDFPRFVRDEQRRWQALVAQRRITLDGSA